MKWIVYVLLLFSLNGWGQSQPENVNTRAGAEASVEYVDKSMTWQRLYFETEIRAIREAVAKVDAVTTTRFEHVNEWKEQSKEREGKFVTRTEIWTAFGGIVAMMFMILNYIKKGNENKLKP